MKRIYVVVLLCLFFSCKKEPQLVQVSGPVFGTGFSIQYYDNDGKSYAKQFDSLFYVINKSMSNYQVNSDISKLNRNEKVTVDDHFKTVFKAAKQIYRETEGVFDPTIGRLVNAWNFGSEENKTALDSATVDSLIKRVGLNRVGLVNDTIKKPKETFIDFNAIAKGYGVDVIADFLESKNIKNYIVDIGGELRAKGINLKKQKGWTVGIENPNFDGSQSVNQLIVLTDEAMATSGTYRKFKIDENGNKYAHIINTKTGFPTKTNILSVSVIAETCMMADGYATAFQAMGIEEVDYFLSTHPELKAYLIFENDKQELETLNLNQFPVK
ncbi:FAD:protein FMN transferase [Olleya aquimaris]|uniref:FAD:protein FMN transferase n=1 Tax=Olleya aquimaris TaxID=639310 RepID=A0A327REI1_9FLAO|nr:FAD:protein FMN transferase [Olleya aquimaris]RAJ14628.1 thiamine biosynthesis lipoprotein [Olleya aquimaris]